MAPGGKRYDTRTRWPCWTLGLTTGSSLSSTSPMLESRPIGHAFKRTGSLDIYVQSIDFSVSNSPTSPQENGNKISTAMCWNQPSVSAGFYFSPRVGSVVGTERNLIHVGWFKKRMHTENVCFLSIYKDHQGHANQQNLTAEDKWIYFWYNFPIGSMSSKIFSAKPNI